MLANITATTATNIRTTSFTNNTNTSNYSQAMWIRVNAATSMAILLEEFSDLGVM